KPFIAKNGVVIGITRMDESPRPGLYTFQKRLQELNIKVPVFEVDARQRQDVKVLLLGLLSVLDPGLRR
ncbi:MAG: GTP-binding protein, partial [Gammaproteobacteria bacterium]|nr:GTP-binding protein [Gammaproteobacteria bacterium]